jgi:hypothetical protein
MLNYETSATVQLEGGIYVDGLPFAPGTEVEVLIQPKLPLNREGLESDESSRNVIRDQMRELFRVIKGFRNSPRILREELYERGSLR